MVQVRLRGHILFHKTLLLNNINLAYLMQSKIIPLDQNFPPRLRKPSITTRGRRKPLSILQRQIKRQKTINLSDEPVEALFSVKYHQKKKENRMKTSQERLVQTVR